MKPELKEKFKAKMQLLLPDKSDFDKYSEIIHIVPRNFIRCNTLKITTQKLMERLSKKWNVVQPYEKYPEIIIIESELGPGELGNSIEHVLGYYYIQEISSMMSVLALDPKPNELVMDLCASPGSKTTQAAARMENSGTLIANDIKMERIAILASNIERCSVSNIIITRNDAVGLCSRLSKNNFKFDKILLDAPCSGEGTLRSSSKTFLIWNEKIVKKLSREQKKLMAYALKCLKKDGILVYSTCTHSPEENESVVDFAVKNFPVEIEELSLPLKTRPGVTNWDEEQFDDSVRKCARIYPQDNDSEGFFVCKMRLKEDIKE